MRSNLAHWKPLHWSDSRSSLERPFGLKCTSPNDRRSMSRNDNRVGRLITEPIVGGKEFVAHDKSSPRDDQQEIDNFANWRRSLFDSVPYQESGYQIFIGEVQDEDLKNPEKNFRHKNLQNELTEELTMPSSPIDFRAFRSMNFTKWSYNL